MNNLGPYPKLSDWEIRELTSRADDILRACPPRKGGHMRGRNHNGRQVRLRSLASEYGVDIRTVYRYLRRAA